MKLHELHGYELGNRTVSYKENDAILYALAVGAESKDMDLVYERDLLILPTYACTLGLWAVESAGALGVYDRMFSLHASQSLILKKPMPKSGVIETIGRITSVWDKGKAALVDIVVESEFFKVSYGIFLPGLGGWGGERGLGSPSMDEETGDIWNGSYATSPNQAALYRLTGDLHPIHIDPQVAQANSFERPILHGLCTLGIAARMISEAANAHPADLKELDARLSSPVMPGDVIEVSVKTTFSGLNFEASVGSNTVIKGGRATFC